MKSQTYIFRRQEDSYQYIIFTFKVIDLNIKEKKITLNESKNITKDLTTKYSFGFEIPNTMDFSKWANIHFYEDYSEAIVYKKYSQAEYHIKINDKNTCSP